MKLKLRLTLKTKIATKIKINIKIEITTEIKFKIKGKTKTEFKFEIKIIKEYTYILLSFLTSLLSPYNENKEGIKVLRGKANPHNIS